MIKNAHKKPLDLKSKKQVKWLAYSPLLIIIAVGLFGVINNLQAESVRPENYGKKNTLFKITDSVEDFEDDLSSEITEGPLDEFATDFSYLSDEAMSEEPLAPPLTENHDSLVATTPDQSSLISPEITDPSTVVKTRDKVVNYAIESGDTLSGIAQKFGISINTLLWENSLSLYSTLKPGQLIKILPVNGLSYQIKNGDNLAKIAKNFQTDVDQIVEFNKLASASDIKSGQTILIPGGVKPSAVAKASSVARAPAPSVKSIFSAPAAAISKARLQWPTSSKRISQYYGWRHTGVDIPNKTGQPIYAAEDGKVETSGWNKGGYGYYVIINHGNGLTTLYAHASKLYVEAGDTVSRGQAIAAIGSTGRSTGPHLHFEVRVNGSRSNPLTYTR